MGRGCGSSKDIERLVGHWTFAALLHRPLLSSLRAVYDYGRSGRPAGTIFPNKVKEELQIMRGLLVFMFADLSLPWCSRVYAYDACGSGHASVSWEPRPGLIQACGAWQERWRYKEDRLVSSARAKALPLDCVAGVRSPAELEKQLSSSRIRYSQKSNVNCLILVGRSATSITPPCSKTKLFTSRRLEVWRLWCVRS